MFTKFKSTLSLSCLESKLKILSFNSRMNAIIHCPIARAIRKKV